MYLRGNVVAEPLCDRWYAWPMLVSPATSAMYAAHSHLRMMESFVAAPEAHRAALANPAMRGGPFIDLGPDRADEIRDLLAETKKRSAARLRFAEAVQELDAILESEATGGSLLPLYPRIPDELRGYVELVYDGSSRPSVRFIEGLLYRSSYYNEAGQEMELFPEDRDDARSFVFSTPRLQNPGRIGLRIPFRSGALDLLFRAKHTNSSVDELIDACGIGRDQRHIFGNLFTTEPAVIRSPFTEEGVRVRYLGHACVLVEAKGVSVLVDPLISYETRSGDGRFTFSDLPPVIDYVLITHGHQDHLMLETLLQLRHRTGSIVVPKSTGGSLLDPSLKLILKNTGFPNVLEMDELDEIELPGGAITCLPFLGEHGDLNIRTKLTYLVELHGRSILFNADSNALDGRLYDHLTERVPALDILFIGMECDGAPLSWIYGPLMTKPLPRKLDQGRRLDGSDCARAMSVVDRLKPREVYVYALGQEPWLEYVTSIRYTDQSRPITESNRLIEECAARGIRAARPFGSMEILLKPQEPRKGAASHVQVG